MTDVFVDLGFSPRPWQSESCQRLKRFSVLVVHRRGGKTLQAILRLITSALKATSGTARYAYIAPLLKQSKAIAWDYLRLYAQKIPQTKVNEAELSVEFRNGSRIRLFGADNPDSLRGLYFDGVVLDEVSQMRRSLWEEMLLPALADRQGWVLVIGTPQGINLFSEIYHKALADSNWYAAKYTVEDTHALSQEEIASLRATLSDRAFRQEMMCDFMAASEDTLISIDDAMLASKRAVPQHLYQFAPRIMGVDVAWQGGDRSVIFKRQGLVAFPPIVERGLPEKTFAARVAHAWDDWKADACFIDTTGGYGGEVLSRLQDAGYNAQGVVFSWKASDPRFANLRAEMWWKMSQWIKEGGAIPDDATLVSELCAPTYSYDNAANRFVLESKDDIRQRLGASPDLADALAITWAFPVAQQRELGMPEHAVKMKHEYDPFEERRE